MCNCTVQVAQRAGNNGIAQPSLRGTSKPRPPSCIATTGNAVCHSYGPRTNAITLPSKVLRRILHNQLFNSR